MRARERQLSHNEWRRSGFYLSDTDERQVLKRLDVAATLTSLACGCVLR